MNVSALPWRKLNDKSFEYLVRALAEIYIPKVDWDIYLKNGNKQDGIDIYGLEFAKKKHVCIQCKFYREMGIPELKKWVDDFENGKFLNTTTKFIIATIADSQKKKLRDYFDQEVLRFSRDYLIELQLWDLGNLEEKLKVPYGLVSHYFGVAIANEHCYSRNRHSIRKYPSVENYIKREVLKVEETNQRDELRFYLGNRDKIELKTIFLADYGITRKICVIADAYQGKSTILKQLAHDLSENEAYIPILIEIKSHSIKPIRAILEESHSYWKEFPTKELVVILDGLDEVAKDKFVDYVKLITEFSLSYPGVSIVFSCRKLFYSHYRLNDSAAGFDFYELFPIKELQIEEYLNKLKGKKESFKKYIAQYYLDDLLYHPFYLVKLVDLYVKSSDASSLPKNKKEILAYLIGESFKPEEQRQLSGGILLAEEKNSYVACVKKMALACQMAGVNSLTSMDVEELFDRSQRELITNSSFLTKQNGLWTFDMSFFQENLAAMALMDMSYETTLKITTVGNTCKKIKTKWIQTMASFISLLDNDDFRRRNLLEFIDRDNPELLTFCDASKFTPSFRMTWLEKIIGKCIKANSFPQIAGLDIIANFIKDCDGAIPYLLTVADDKPTSVIKSLCWKIVYNHDGLAGNDDLIKERIFKTLTEIDDGGTARVLVNILSKFKLVSAEDIKELLGFERLNLHTEYLNAVFELLIDYQFVDEHYSIGVASIELFEKYEREHSHYGAQATLAKFLLSATTAKNIFFLLTQIFTKKWSLVYGDSHFYDDKDRLLSKLCDLAVHAYQYEPLVMIPMGHLVKYQLQRHYDEKPIILYDFFKRTSTNWLFFRLCLQDFPAHSTSHLAYIITKDCFNYIFSEYEDGAINERSLEEWYSWIKYWRKDEPLADAFYSELIAVTGSQTKEIRERENLEFRELEQVREENDLRVIQSPEAFIEGLKNFFSAYGNTSIAHAETYVGYSTNLKRRRSDSSFFSHFFMQFNTDEISLDQCIALILREGWFKDFQAKEICSYNFPNEQSKQILLQILQDYYLREIKKTDFTNAIKQRGNNYRISGKPNLLKSIFEKFDFETSETELQKLIWLIQEGFSHLQTSTFKVRHSPSLSQILLERVNHDALIKTVLLNIKLGIEADFVLSSHLEFCRYLKIAEVKRMLLQPQIFDRFPSHQQGHIVDIYLELGGQKDTLLLRFNKIGMAYAENEYLYLDLAKKLIVEYPDEISHSLLISLHDHNIPESVRIEFAKLLVDVGNENGFSFLVRNPLATAKALGSYHSSLSLSTISTTFALNELDLIKHHLLDKDLPLRSREFYTVKDFIISSLHELSKKGEEDLLLVERFLHASYEEFKPVYLNASEILFYIDRLLESFRESDTNYQIAELKKMLT